MNCPFSNEVAFLHSFLDSLITNSVHEKCDKSFFVTNKNKMCLFSFSLLHKHDHWYTWFTTDSLIKNKADIHQGRKREGGERVRETKKYQEIDRQRTYYGIVTHTAFHTIIWIQQKEKLDKFTIAILITYILSNAYTVNQGFDHFRCKAHFEQQGMGERERERGGGGREKRVNNWQQLHSSEWRVTDIA